MCMLKNVGNVGKWPTGHGYQGFEVAHIGGQCPRFCGQFPSFTLFLDFYP